MVLMWQEEDLLKPDARGMVMCVLYLYMTLPNLMPKTTLEFAGKLGEKQVGCWDTWGSPAHVSSSLNVLAGPWRNRKSCRNSSPQLLQPSLCICLLLLTLCACTPCSTANSDLSQLHTSQVCVGLC